MLPRLIKPAGTALGIAGAILVAAGRTDLVLPALGCWTLSSVAWAWVAWRQSESSLLILSLAYILLDLIGLWRWATAPG